MAGEGGVDRNMRGLRVAYLADHDDIRVLAQERAHGGRETEPDLRLHLRLVYALDLVFHRVLDSEDLARRVVENGEHSGEGSGLSAARGAGDHDHAVRKREQSRKPRLVRARHPQTRDLE